MKISLKESNGEKVLTIDVGTSYRRGGKVYLRAHEVESLLREKYDLTDYSMVEYVDVLSNFAGESVAEYKFVKKVTKSKTVTSEADPPKPKPKPKKNTKK